MTGKGSQHESPTAFVSYSWDSDGHKAWTKDFATRLRSDGVNVTLDSWSTAHGDQLPQFMETAIRENSYILIVCTANYKTRSDNRTGGVGYEGDIMTGELFTEGNARKFIPILRSGSWANALPSWLKGRYGVDLTGTPYSERNYQDLLTTFHNRREQAPPVGGPRGLHTSISAVAKKAVRTNDRSRADFDPIKIEGVLLDEVGQPKNDGTRGSALYVVPFKLSRVPPPEWADLFVTTWDNPPQFSTQHRPGIAKVRGDRIILTRTTIEEVQEAHRDTLKLVVDTINPQIADLMRKRLGAEAAKAEQQEQHRAKVKAIADGIKFD